MSQSRLSQSKDTEEKKDDAFNFREVLHYSAALPKVTEEEEENRNSKLGTLCGVYIPCCQNILGVIVFLRLIWLIGEAGSLEGFQLILTCCLITFTTSIAMAAIATNGPVPAGGAYHMIKRCLGTEFGGAVGILFYLGTTFGCSMYVIGAIEILLRYLIGSQGMISFSNEEVSLENDALLVNNYRMYGTVLLVILAGIVWVGIAIVTKFAIIALCCVILALLSIFAGLIANAGGNDQYLVCVVGKRLVRYVGYEKCTQDGLVEFMCENETMSCDPYFERHLDQIGLTQAFPGITSNIFYDSLYNLYSGHEHYISWSYERTDYSGLITGNTSTFLSQHWVVSDAGKGSEYTFLILLGIFFPSCTGIMAGSNRSGDLKYPEKAIPFGTTAAIITTSCIYLSLSLLYSASVDRLVALDKFGKSLSAQGAMVVSYLSWPYKQGAAVPTVTELGALLSTIGAGLQALTGAPRLLAAISSDGFIPVLTPFAQLNTSGEPVRALALTVVIAEIGVVIGELDMIAPLLSMFFLLFYAGVNIACTSMSLSAHPGWRPSFKYYHWSVSLVGVILCLIAMFVIDYLEALLAIFIFALCFVAIKYFGGVQEWGEGIRGLALTHATTILIRVSQQYKMKYWRPHMLLMINLKKKAVSKTVKASTSDHTGKRPTEKLPYRISKKDIQLFNLGSQIKQGAGLAIACCALHVKQHPGKQQVADLRVMIKQEMKDQNLDGLAEITFTRKDLGVTMKAALVNLVQLSGLGILRPNTVLINFPRENKLETSSEYVKFKQIIEEAIYSEMAIVSPVGGVRQWDEVDSKRTKGYIDMVLLNKHDTGLILMIAHLMHNHPMWTKCHLRVLIPLPQEVRHDEEQKAASKKEWQRYLRKARVNAGVKLLYCEQASPQSLNKKLLVLQEQGATKLTLMSMRIPDADYVPDDPTDKYEKWLDQLRQRVRALHDCILIWNAGMSVIEVNRGLSQVT